MPITSITIKTNEPLEELWFEKNGKIFQPDNKKELNRITSSTITIFICGFCGKEWEMRNTPHAHDTDKVFEWLACHFDENLEMK